jgi:hypoxanthine phosphoribosyltransferase
VDTGLTTGYLLEHLKVKGPASVKLCALLDKPARRLREAPIDYLGFSVPDRFLVGYGLDVDQKYRNLPAIYAIEETEHGH